MQNIDTTCVVFRVTSFREDLKSHKIILQVQNKNTYAHLKNLYNQLQTSSFVVNYCKKCINVMIWSLSKSKVNQFIQGLKVKPLQRPPTSNWEGQIAFTEIIILESAMEYPASRGPTCYTVACKTAQAWTEDTLAHIGFPDFEMCCW